MRHFVASGAPSGRRGEKTIAVGNDRNLGTMHLTIAMATASREVLPVVMETELKTLADAIAQIVDGQAIRAADTLMQRFQAVELSRLEGRGTASRVEVIPPPAVS